MTQHSILFTFSGQCATCSFPLGGPLRRQAAAHLSAGVATCALHCFACRGSEVAG